MENLDTEGCNDPRNAGKADPIGRPANEWKETESEASLSRSAVATPKARNECDQRVGVRSRKGVRGTRATGDLE
jgi:hypothetical protein